MQAVVLVGGMGTRLRPLTHETPKQMLAIAGVTMLERVVARLAKFGVDRVVLSMGYMPDVFLAAFPNNRVAGVEIVYAVEPEPLDTAGGIKFAADYGAIEETYLVVNGDVICDFDVAKLVESHKRNSGLATIALVPVEDPSAFGVVPTADDGRVLAFIEKPPRESAPTNYINAGIYVLEPDALASVPVGSRSSIEKVVFPHLVASGSLYATQFEGYWIDAGTIDNFYATNMKFLSVLVRSSQGLAEAAEVSLVGGIPAGYNLIDGSLVATTAQIASDVRLISSVVGPGVVIESGVLVMHSIVMATAVISHHSHVMESIVGNEVLIPPETMLDDLCVIADGSDLSAGVSLSGEKIPK